MFKVLSPESVETLILIGIVVFGAIVHATAQLKVARDNNRVFTGVDFLILSTIASFSGMIFGLAASVYFTNIVMVALFAGVGAFLGMAGLNRLSNFLLDVLIQSRK
tara:strand:+ start:934 stop:1251 length:318 start_codon:yes stop_codon:yes gene_type:complete